MVLNRNASRAEVYDAVVSYYQELLSLDIRRVTSKTLELRSFLEHIMVAFHPDSIPLLPCAECILSRYPPNPYLFHSCGRLRIDMRNSDGDRVSRAIAYAEADIDCFRQQFSEMMTMFVGWKDPVRKSIIIGDMKTLGAEWAISEARIQAVELWFELRWGVNGACI